MKHKRRAKQKSEDKTPDDLRKMAEALCAEASYLEYCAGLMEAGGIKSIRRQIGNWNNAVAAVNRFISSQIFLKIMMEDAKLGHDVRQFMRGKVGSANYLGQNPGHEDASDGP